ncbi:MAG: HD domain-containing protein [Patescibacteria group bacterium]
MTKKLTADITKFFYEMGTLRKIVRAHRQTLLTDDLSDNIASHTFRVCIIGMMLAQLEKADISKVVLMCLLHDITESRSGDQNWVHKKYVQVFEDDIIKSQIKPLPNSKELLIIINEYRERKTREAQIAKDADRLDQTLLENEYVWMGNQEAKTWGRTNRTNLFSKSAKSLLREICKQKPSDWWTNGGWSDERR